MSFLFAYLPSVSFTIKIKNVNDEILLENSLGFWRIL